MIHVLVTDHYQPESLAKLKATGNFIIEHSCDTYPTETELKPAHVLLIRSRTDINEKLLKKAPNLKLVVSATAGFDHIDYVLAAHQNVICQYTPQANDISAAEHTMSLILGLCKNLINSHQAILNGAWRNQLPRRELLQGKTLCLIGLGRIGSKVASMAQAFSMKVFAHDPYVDDSVYQSLKVERIGLVEAFRHADYLSLHVPLTKKTRGMINKSTLAEFSSDCFLINASRGGVIIEQELVEALKAKKLAGAALDVFNSEPLPIESPLRQLPNVILTPHAGAYTEQALQMASNQAVEKVIDFFAGASPLDTVPPLAEWAKDL